MESPCAKVNSECFCAFKSRFLHELRVFKLNRMGFFLANKHNCAAAVLSLCSAPAHSWPMDLRVHAASGGSDAAMLGDVLDVSEIL